MTRLLFAWPGAAIHLALAAAMALAGCSVGPDFRTPTLTKEPEASHAYTAAPLPAETASAPGTGGASQRFVSGQEIPALWWQLFRSEALDRLVRSSLDANPTLATAQAQLRQALEAYEADSGSRLLPSVSAQGGAQRQRAAAVSSGVPGGLIYNVYSASVNLSYTIDAFGGFRRELEGLLAAVDYQNYQLEAAYLSLSSNVVATAIQEASLRAQLKATGNVLEAETRSLSLLEKQAAFGAIARGTLLTQRALVAQTRATLPGLEKSLAQTRHQLTALAGRLPGDSGDLPAFELESLQLPEEVPVSLPSDLLRQRPDIRASEALLHEASAQVGVAVANLYPQITLNGSAGLQSLQISKLFTGSAVTWGFGAGLVQPIFNGGALQARRRQAVAAFEAAQSQYQQTVLTAFQSVANALQALDSDAQTLRAQAESESLARQSLELITAQYRLGAVSFLSLLDIQRTYLQTRVALTQAQSARFADTAALFQALGGGWWARQALVERPATPSGDRPVVAR